MIKPITATLEVLVVDRDYNLYGDINTSSQLLALAHYAMMFVYTEVVPGSYTLTITKRRFGTNVKFDLQKKD